MGLTNIPEIHLGEGWVTHARVTTKKNSFRYPIFNLLIPVHNEGAFKNLLAGFPFSLAAKDFLEGKPGRLIDNLRDFLNQAGVGDYDQVWLQTLPRMFGYVFNPVSFWYIYKGSDLKNILCEVNNTFGDRHFYLLSCQDKGPAEGFVTDKVFHVSPFFPTQGQYKFDFSIEAHRTRVSIALYDNEQLQLNTHIDLKIQPQKPSAFYILRKYGWLTVLVVLRIHYQALRLWIKGITFFSRPSPPSERITYDHRIGKK